MAHFAELNADNIVTRVIVVGNQDCLDENGQESEAVGIAFCQQLFGADTRWVQTSYNATFRKRYAGAGHSYDEGRDAFIPSKPALGDDWVFDEDNLIWRPPVELPDDGKQYVWNFETKQWQEVIQPPAESEA
jgi:hypothetical protein